MRSKGSAAELEARRREAVALLRQQYSVGEVAERFGVTPAAVRHWKRAAEQGGLRALKSKPQHVPTSQLSKKQKTELTKILIRGAAAAGYPTDLWTCQRVAEVTRKKFGIDYHPGHMSRILHELGFSCQKPAQQAKERDDAAAEVFREKTWAAIKKGRKTRS